MAKVLVVEDDAYVSELFDERLTEKGNTVWLTDNGTEAAEVVDRRHPDIVILDLKAAEADAVEALDQLLDIEPTPPVIVCNAHTCYIIFAASVGKNGCIGRRRALRMYPDTRLKEVKTILETARSGGRHRERDEGCRALAQKLQGVKGVSKGTITEYGKALVEFGPEGNAQLSHLTDAAEAAGFKASAWTPQKSRGVQRHQGHSHDGTEDDSGSHEEHGGCSHGCGY